MDPPDAGEGTENHSPFLLLPAEIRIAIFEYAFNDDIANKCFVYQEGHRGLILDEEYGVQSHLQALSACRQFYKDAHLLAISKTNFVVSNLFFHIPNRLVCLNIKQIESIRNITFEADARHFRRLIEWGDRPFGMRELRLDTVTIVLHRSSFWHYLFDFTADIAKLLRILHGVRRLVFLRNDALVKGSFKTWYNRLVGLIMKVDHHERYDKTLPNPEMVWWEWSYDSTAHRICLEACPPRPLMDEEEYMLRIQPLMEELRESIESEEWNPDPRSRLPFY